MKILYLLAAMMLATLAGCGQILYLPSTHQGGTVAQSSFKKLKVGAHEADVVQLVGSPSFKNVMHDNQWYYVLDSNTSKQINTYKLVFKQHHLSQISLLHT